MYKNLLNIARRCEESEFHNILAARQRELHHFPANPPDRLSFRYLTNGNLEIFLVFNTAAFIITMARSVFDELDEMIQQGATLEEVVYMLNLPR